MPKDNHLDKERRFARAFLDAHPDEVTLLLERMPPNDVAGFLEQLPVASAVEVLRRMALAIGADALERLSTDRAIAILSLLPVDSAAGLLRRVEIDRRKAFLAALPDDAVSTLAVLLRYPEHTAGAYMDTRVLALPQELTVGEARNRLRRAARQALFYIYVVDREQQLAGVVNLRELMLADGKQPLADVMQRNVARIPIAADHPEILAHPAWRDVHALPVVDERNVFLGAIRYGTLRALESAYASSRQSKSPAALALSLGELYWLGVSQLLERLQSARPQRQDSPNGGHHQ
jgi:magnesium transporter